MIVIKNNNKEMAIPITNVTSQISSVLIYFGHHNFHCLPGQKYIINKILCFRQQQYIFYRIFELHIFKFNFLIIIEKF